MPRYYSGTDENNDFYTELDGSIYMNIEPAGFMGVFGSGLYKVFYRSGTFIIPSNVTQIRVRVVGAGGCMGTETGQTVIKGNFGGAGGGYAHGVFTVVPGTSYPVTVGLGGSTNGYTNGGSSSFGSLISATGGESGTTVNQVPALPIPGQGFGGDFQAKGGSSDTRCGGGAAGSQLGDGGWGRSLGGGAVGGNDSIGGVSTAYSGQGSTENRNFHLTVTSLGLGGASPFNISQNREGGCDIFQNNLYPDYSQYSATHLDNYNLKSKTVIRFPFDGFIGNGGPASVFGYEKDPSVSQLSAADGVTRYVTNVLKLNRAHSGGPGAGGGGGYTANDSLLGEFGGNGGVGAGGGASVVGYATSINIPTSYHVRNSNGGLGGGGGYCTNRDSTTFRCGNGGDGIVIIEY